MQMLIHIAAHGTLPTTSVGNAIAAVAVQEYIALYLNPEAWTLGRRTGVLILHLRQALTEFPAGFYIPRANIL